MFIFFNENDASLNYFVDNGGSIVGNLNNMSYTTLVNNIGSSLILSQSQNKQSIDLYGDFQFSGVYYSSQNSYTLLRYVDNLGTINYKNQTMGQTNRIAGISLSENIDYLNVSFQGQINIYNLIMQTSTTTEKQLYVSGFTQTLSMNRWIKK